MAKRVELTPLQTAILEVLRGEPNDRVGMTVRQLTKRLRADGHRCKKSEVRLAVYGGTPRSMA